MVKRQKKSRAVAGDRLKVVGTCGVRNDDDSSVRSVELRGETVTAAGVNCNYDHAETGEPMVAATLDSGALTAIPARCLKPVRRGVGVGYSSKFAAGFRRIFGT